MKRVLVITIFPEGSITLIAIFTSDVTPEISALIVTRFP